MTYDALSRMTEWRQVGSGAPKVERHIYRGAEWHRAGTVVKDGAGAAKATAYLYDGDNVCADFSEHGGALAAEAFYVTPFLDQNLLMIKDGKTYWYSQDGLGSVRTLTDADGEVVNRYDYTAFGETWAAGTSGAVKQRYGFTGREVNPSSGMMSYRYRTYSGDVGRFLEKDPLGYFGCHDGNLYSYAGNNVTSFTDPSGLTVGVNEPFIFIFHFDVADNCKNDPNWSNPNGVMSANVKKNIEDIFKNTVRGPTKFKWRQRQPSHWWKKGTGRDTNIGDFIPFWNIGRWMQEAISGAHQPKKLVVMIWIDCCEESGLDLGSWNGWYDVTIRINRLQRLQQSLPISLRGRSNLDYAIANILAHEIGFHAIAGRLDLMHTPESKEGEWFIDQHALSQEFFEGIGRFSEPTRNEIRRELDM